VNPSRPSLVAVLYSQLVNQFSATTPGTWVVKHIASKVDPVIFRATNGRWTSTGLPTLPMLTLTTTGRKTGRPHAVQLAYHRDGDDYLVVASSMGSQHHPAWRYNLEAAGTAEVRVRDGVFIATATVLTAPEKQRLWPAIQATIPQMATYVRRTDRDIRVFRLTRTGDVR
jgi:deazaflavin-dependent oxidoreductase (nitroreductase family)